MGTTEIVVMSIFGFLVLGALVLAVRQGARERQELARYAARHGWSVSTEGDVHLAALLTKAAPAEKWTPRNVLQVEAAPQSVYLFSHQATSKDMPSQRSKGHAGLAERTGRRQDWPVVIFSQTPGVEERTGVVHDRDHCRKRRSGRKQVGGDGTRVGPPGGTGEETAGRGAVDVGGDRR